MTDIEPLQLELQANGFCVLHDVIPSSACEIIRNSVVRAVEHQREHYPNAPRNIGFTPSIINHDQSFAEYLVHNDLIALVQWASPL